VSGGEKKPVTQRPEQAAEASSGLETPFMMCLSCTHYLLRAGGAWKLIGKLVCQHGTAKKNL